MKYKKFLLVLFAIFFLQAIYAENYYADVQIEVKSDGSTNIFGSTNYPQFLNITNSQGYTSKKGDMWTLNISTKETFEDFVYELTLPENANINYIKTTPKFRIENEENKIKIIGVDENKPLTLIVQYQIKPINNFFSEKNIILVIILIFIISLLIVIFIGFRFVKKLNLDFKTEIEKLKKKAKFRASNMQNKTENEKVPKNSEQKNEKKTLIDLSKFPLRQQEIITILITRKKITQKELETQMKIPKSSISRNVQALVSKNIIIKENKGMTNYLSLKDGGQEIGVLRQN